MTTAGIRVATVPVFEMNADRMAVPAIITTSRRTGLPRAPAIRCSPANAVTPVRVNPSPTTKSAPTRTTVGLEKPESASPRLSWPQRKRESRDPIATRSEGSFPHMKSAMVSPRIAKTTDMSLIRIPFFCESLESGEASPDPGSSPDPG